MAVPPSVSTSATSTLNRIPLKVTLIVRSSPGTSCATTCISVLVAEAPSSNSTAVSTTTPDLPRRLHHPTRTLPPPAPAPAQQRLRRHSALHHVMHARHKPRPFAL